MTVHCIPPAMQDFYCVEYMINRMTVEDIMYDSDRSRRTVKRMLESYGFDPVYDRKHKVGPYSEKSQLELSHLSTQQKKPGFLQRSYERIKQWFNFARSASTQTIQQQ